MAFLALLALYFVLRDKVQGSQLLLRFLPWAILLPYLANTTGWLMTELGRAPWIVFGLMKIDSAVSPASVVSSVSILITLVLFTAVYGSLMVVTVYLLQRFARVDPDAEIQSVGAY